MPFGPVSRVMPADIAIQEAYGIPDGQVNGHFEVSDSTSQRDSTYRTLNEDMAAEQEYARTQNSQDSQEGSVPQLTDLVDQLPQSPQLPELPQSPQLPQSSQPFELPQLAEIQFPSFEG